MTVLLVGISWLIIMLGIAWLFGSMTRYQYRNEEEELRSILGENFDRKTKSASITNTKNSSEAKTETQE